ncbi:MAG: hypothetical protein AMXMBFR53_35440 [Gemmatimonadota bacterium]
MIQGEEGRHPRGHPTGKGRFTRQRLGPSGAAVVHQEDVPFGANVRQERGHALGEGRGGGPGPPVEGHDDIGARYPVEGLEEDEGHIHGAATSRRSVLEDAVPTAEDLARELTQARLHPPLARPEGLGEGRKRVGPLRCHVRRGCQQREQSEQHP